ncbi:SDR family oxidoreductase [Shimia sp. MMG029]|uniref:SDR family oxidoreductase n=1 Tax=Shimia sp. MMG029 TaxID=3021978 RepID=UPI0022FDB6AA|nr:SDR family oxidoreductase [Shimia sp. MMG029]MDA5557523.1 SDR family oxidoreductase [Shimia sp. MMG029]
MRAAFITGGSSGIGFAAAMQLAIKGHDLALFARDASRLLAAREAILQEAPAVKIETYAVDVANEPALTDALEDALAKLGAPEMAIASAGIAQPGLFRAQSPDLHRRHMAVNYFGTLTFVQILSKPMAQAGGGHIGLISSGAAFFGIYGYGAYAPSKFALRGLGEILHLELADANITTTVIYPPDTDTPQLLEEKRTKPAATQKITEGGGLWQPEDIAARLIAGMRAGRPSVAPGFQMAALNRLGSLLSPLLRWHQKRIISQHNTQ